MNGNIVYNEEVVTANQELDNIEVMATNLEPYNGEAIDVDKEP